MISEVSTVIVKTIVSIIYPVIKKPFLLIVGELCVLKIGTLAGLGDVFTTVTKGVAMIIAIVVLDSTVKKARAEERKRKEDNDP